MSIEMGSVDRTAPSAMVGNATSSSAAARSHETAASDPVTVDTIPASPPPEVHAAMSVAATAYEKLKLSGTELHFRIDTPSGKVVVEVHDIHGNLLFTVPPSSALKAAAGEELDSHTNPNSPS
jgi:uncharacterized FlaG/YvyC family protein